MGLSRRGGPTLQRARGCSGKLHSPWTDQKFANRGAGIEATDIPFGVKLTLPYRASAPRLRVHCEFYDARRIKDLYALAELVVADDDNFDENTEGKV